MTSPCTGCGAMFASNYARTNHMNLCTVQPPGTSTRPKSECPHHGWDEYGRPIPPVGYCGDRCWMRPGVAEHEAVA